MGNSPGSTLDFSKAQRLPPLPAGYKLDAKAAVPPLPSGYALDAASTLDFSKAQRLPPAGTQSGTERALQQGLGGPPMFVDVPAGQKESFEQAGQRGYQTGAAIGAGLVAGAGTIGSLLAPTVTTGTVGTGILGPTGEEVTRDIATQGPSLARAGLNVALNAIKAHPFITGYIATHLANDLGVPLPKILKSLALIREPAE